MKRLDDLKEKALRQQNLNIEEAFFLLEYNNPLELFWAANEIREKFKGKKINLCSIGNAKSGKCSEDCTFCAQSGHFETGSLAYPLRSTESMITEVIEAQEVNKAERFGIVTSGRRVATDTELATISEMLQEYPIGMGRCASLGTITYEQCLILKENGLETLHHNLETARSFYANICSTHSYDDRYNTLMAGKKAGLKLCSGGIFGLGETLEQRVELAFELKTIDPDGIPLNFLSPVPGTPLESQPLLEPLEALKIIAMFRFVHPTKTIRIGGGREKVLRDLQPLMFIAGANATLTGNYLTTVGKKPEEDQQMIRDLGFVY